MAKFSMTNIKTNTKIYIPIDLDENKLPKDILGVNANAIPVRILHN